MAQDLGLRAFTFPANLATWTVPMATGAITVDVLRTTALAPRLRLLGLIPWRSPP